VTEEKVSPVHLESGLVVPSAMNKQYSICVVVRVGPGSMYAAAQQSETHDLKTGQRVLVMVGKPAQDARGGYAIQPLGLPLKDGGADIKLIEESQIVAILEDPASTDDD